MARLTHKKRNKRPMDQEIVRRYSKARGFDTVSAAASWDHFYTFGDVYETVDACDQLELLLGRLRRQRLLSEGEWLQLRDHVAKIRAHLESRLTQSA